jgi:Icc-related predicted phosphoesterase
VQRPAKSVRIVCLSDTHEFHRELDIPDGDILIHAGDFSFFSRRPAMFADFNAWLGELPHRVKIVVPGNHEFLLEGDDQAAHRLSNATLLINRGVQACGLRIWGSPVTALSGGAFGLSSIQDRRRIYQKIPAGTDILITHGPPHGILDCEDPGSPHSGCPVLWERVMEVKPHLHVFGHIHGGYGTVKIGPTTFANVAMWAGDDAAERRPFTITLQGR